MSNSDPTYALTHDQSGPFDAAASDRWRREKYAKPTPEIAVARPPENAAFLAHAWGTPIELVRRVLVAEEQLSFLQSEIIRLQERLAGAESRAGQKLNAAVGEL